MSKLYIGLMSGTSADGIDAILIEFSDIGLSDKEKPAFSVKGTHHLPYSDHFRQQLLELALDHSCTKKQLATLSAKLADLSAQAVNHLLMISGLSPDAITAIGSHGHTIDHAPDAVPPYTLQITDHARLTEKTGITVVGDFRSRDVAAGGQGAPLVPAFHQWLFKQNTDKQSTGRAVVNIGGISNLTLLNSGAGFDCGPGNCLIDSWHFQNSGEHFDHNGESARNGQLIPDLLEQMLQDNYFSKKPPKSTGREYFNQQWLARHLDARREHWQDVAHTLTALTAKVIAEQLTLHSCVEAFVCGGGSHNSLLLEFIRDYASPHLALKTTADLGIEPDWVEAGAFAWLAHQTIHKKPGNLPSATGAKGYRILGAIYPA